MAGKVLVDNVPATKPGVSVGERQEIRLRGQDHPYVSRGGVKLASALTEFQISANGRTAMDVGASTGGFTQVLLLDGAVEVFAVDVGHSQLDWKIRSDPKVKVFEHLNARYIRFEQIGKQVDVIVVDVSFISLKLILPALLQFSHERSDWITLIKPQFEVGRANVGKKGIVTSEEAKLEVLRDLHEFGASIGLVQTNVLESPIHGTDGNQEYLARWQLKNP